jgi:hypothetical protein
MITYNVPRGKDIQTIRQGDSNFHIDDGLALYPRAMIHVTPDCPIRVREYLQWAMENGYVKCVAHVYGKELTMDALR